MADESELDKIKKEVVKEGATESGSSKSPGTQPAQGESILGTKLGEMAKGIGETKDTAADNKSDAATAPDKTADGTSPASGESAPPSQKAPSAPAPGQPSADQLKKEITGMVKKSVDSKLSGLKEDMKGLEKISGLESKINQITEKLNSQVFQPPPQAAPVQGGGSSISRELASFGEEVDFQTELYETKKTMASIAKSLDTLSKKMEYRISILEDRSKSLERIPDLEERVGDIRQKLGPENVQKLRKLIFSSDEIVDEVIPDLVNKKLRSKLDPAMNEIRDMQETMNDFNSKLSHVKEEVLNLEKLRDDIQELRADKENLYKDLDEEETRANERIDVLKQNVRHKLEKLADKVNQDFKDLKKSQADMIQSEVKNAFLNLSEPRFSDLEKGQDIIDDRLKRMAKADAELEKKISSIEAPENIKKWLENRVSKLEHGMLSDIKSLKKDDVSNAAAITRLAEDFKTFYVSMQDVPKRLGTQGNMINKLLDTKDYFAGRAERLVSEMKGLSERLAALRAELSGLEQKQAGQEARFSDNLNAQRDYLASARADMAKHLNSEIASMRRNLEKKTQEQNKTALAEFKTEFKKIASTEEELKALRKIQDSSLSRLQKQVSDLQAGLKGAYPEISLQASRIKEMEESYNALVKELAEAYEYHKASDSSIRAELMKYLESSMKSLKKEIESRRSEDAKAQVREFKDELRRLEALSQELSAFKASQEKRVDELSQGFSSLSGPITDLKALIKRVDELEGISMAADKRLDVVEDRGTGQANSLANRINLIEKAINDINISHKDLEKRVVADNRQLQGALGQVISDREGLEKEMSEQRSRIGELIKELKNV